MLPHCTCPQFTGHLIHSITIDERRTVADVLHRKGGSAYQKQKRQAGVLTLVSSARAPNWPGSIAKVHMQAPPNGGCHFVWSAQHHNRKPAITQNAATTNAAAVNLVNGAPALLSKIRAPACIIVTRPCSRKRPLPAPPHPPRALQR